MNRQRSKVFSDESLKTMDNLKILAEKTPDNYCRLSNWKDGHDLNHSYNYLTCMEDFVMNTNYGPVRVYLFEPEMKIYHGSMKLSASGNEFPLGIGFYNSKPKSLSIDKLVSPYSVQYFTSKTTNEPSYYGDKTTSTRIFGSGGSKIYIFDNPMLGLSMQAPETILLFLNVIHQKMIEYRNDPKKMAKYYFVGTELNLYVDNNRNPDSQTFNHFIETKYYEINEMIKSGKHVLLTDTRWGGESDLYKLLNRYILSNLNLDIGGFVEYQTSKSNHRYMIQLIIVNPSKYLRTKSVVRHGDLEDYPNLSNFMNYLEKFRNINFEISSGNILDQIVWSILINDRKFEKLNQLNSEDHQISSVILLFIRLGEMVIDHDMKYNHYRNEILVGNRPSAEILFERLVGIMNGKIILKNYYPKSEMLIEIDFDKLLNEVLDTIGMDPKLNNIIRSILLRESDYNLDQLFEIIDQGCVNPLYDFITHNYSDYFVGSKFVSPKPYHFPFLRCPSNRYPSPKIKKIDNRIIFGFNN